MAERVRKTLAELEFPVKAQTLRITASCGVAAGVPGRRFRKTKLERLEALRSAKSCGRDCVARFGEYAAESPIDDEISPLGLLQDSIARNSSAHAAWNSPRRFFSQKWRASSAAHDCRPSPSWTAKARLTGLVTEAAVRAARISGSRKMADAMSQTSQRSTSGLIFSRSCNTSPQHPEAVAIVVRDRQDPRACSRRQPRDARRYNRKALGRGGRRLRLRVRDRSRPALAGLGEDTAMIDLPAKIDGIALCQREV